MKAVLSGLRKLSCKSTICLLVRKYIIRVHYKRPNKETALVSSLSNPKKSSHFEVALDALVVQTILYRVQCNAKKRLTTAVRKNLRHSRHSRAVLETANFVD